MEMPRICVCTAPDAATAQTSELITVTAGATAVGGGDLTVVVESEVLLEVESVMIGSTAQAFNVAMTKSTATAIFLFIFNLFSVMKNRCS